MKLKKSDFDEVDVVMNIIQKTDNLNKLQIKTLIQEIHALQPFYINVLNSYKFDLNSEEFDEIAKIFIIMWEFLKFQKITFSKKLTEQEFIKVRDQLLFMLKYLEGETNEKEAKKIIQNDIEKIQSKALFTAIIYRYNTQPNIIKISNQVRGFIFIDLKTFLIYFENTF
jgi:hypothetical protein